MIGSQSSISQQKVGWKFNSFAYKASVSIVLTEE